MRIATFPGFVELVDRAKTRLVRSVHHNIRVEFGKLPMGCFVASAFAG